MSTASRRPSDWRDNWPAASSTWFAALPVSFAPSETPVMLLLTSWVPVAASWMLREVSPVAADCSATAAAMVAAEHGKQQ